MNKTILKWANRCLGWILMGCVALTVLSGYILHKKTGYGTMDLRLIWRDKVLSVDQMAGGDCELVVRGKRVAWTAGKGVRLRPGPAAVELRVRGFRVCSISVSITKDTPTIAEFRLEAEPRTITVNNVKSNGVVNGKPSGRTWVLQGAEVGRSYAVEVSAPGFHTNRLSLQVEKPGEDLVTNLVWQPLMGFVRVSVPPSVGDAVVSVDGTALDPIVGGLVEVGPHTLSVSSGDYYPYNQRVEVSYGVTSRCQVVLRPKPAQLTIQVIPAVQYQLRDGIGETLALQAGTVELPAGTNSLTLSARGYIAQRRDFILEPNHKYSWPVELEREGLQVYKTAEADFKALTNANGVLLEKRGGRDWEQIQKATFDTEDLLQCAKQYEEACKKLRSVVEDAKLLDVWQQRFKLVADDINNRVVLEQFGGSDWQQIRLLGFGSEELAEKARQYETAYSTLTNLLLRCYKLRDQKRATNEAWAEKQAQLASEREALWNRAESMRKSINQVWIVRSGNALAWKLDLDSATRLVDEFEKAFGPGSQYGEWFGSVQGEVMSWRRRIELSRPQN